MLRGCCHVCVNVLYVIERFGLALPAQVPIPLTVRIGGIYPIVPQVHRCPVLLVVMTHIIVTPRHWDLNRDAHIDAIVASWCTSRLDSPTRGEN